MNEKSSVAHAAQNVLMTSFIYYQI